MPTYSAKPKDVKRTWYLIDGSELSLGRLATRIATLLTGKEKPIFTKHIDCGDYVIVINSAKLKVTGNKLNDKVYYRHSGYPGNLRETSLNEQLVKDPNEVIRRAVRGMLPVNKLRADRLNRLKIYPDEKHNHEAQKPVVLTLKGAK